MATPNDIKAAITESIDPLEEILDDMADVDPMMIYTEDVMAIIESMESAIEYLRYIRNMVEDLIG